MQATANPATSTCSLSLQRPSPRLRFAVLAESAASPVVSTIKNFREEYEAHINEKRCPAGVCQKLKRIEIQPDKCKGCSKCSRGLSMSGPSAALIKSPFVIDQSKCIKCGACVTNCPFHAIEVK